MKIRYDCQLPSASRVADMLGMTRQTFYRHLNEGDVPPHTHVISGIKRWSKSVIEDFIHGRIVREGKHWVRRDSPFPSSSEGGCR